jgi:hypothetical protein
LFHDHDDVMNAGALAVMYEALEADQELYLVMGKARDFFSPELTATEKRTVRIREEAYHGLFTGAALMRRALFERIGLFEESLEAGEIIAFMGKLEAMGLKHEKIDFVASGRRVHGANYGRTNTLARILRRILKAES